MTAVPFNKQIDITDVAVSGDTAHVHFHYPGRPGRPKYLEVGLFDVRASDGIRVHYDFARDGFVVCQPKPRINGVERRKGAPMYLDLGEDWIEVGFFQSWKFHEWEDGCPSEAEIEAFEANQQGAGG